LAYLNLREGDYKGVMNYCNEALKLNPQNLYAHVLRAQVYFGQKDIENARNELDNALKTAEGVNWEQAEAHTLFGRIQELQGKTQEALSSYEEAIRLDPANSVAYTNKGTLLSRLGNYQSAVASYQDLLKVSDNPTARLLATEGQRQLAFQADERKRERIRELINDIHQQEQGKNTKQAVPTEKQWRSQPLTISVCPFSVKGSPTFDASTDLYLQARLLQKIGTEPGRSIVNREFLDGILQELQLAQSALADKEKALQVGRIAGANIIVTGTLFNLGGKLQAVLQVIETETTYIKAALSEERLFTETLGAFSDRVSEALTQAIDAAFPLKGQITDITGEVMGHNNR